MWAAADGHADVVTTLLVAGAEFSRSAAVRFYAVAICRARRADRCARVLLKAGADVTEAMQPKKTASLGPGGTQCVDVGGREWTL